MERIFTGRREIAVGRLTALFSNRTVTGLMQGFDVFEKSKVLVEAPVTFNWDQVTPGAEVAAKLVEHLDDAPYRLIALFNDSEVFWVDPDVRTVSTGEGWMLLADMIECLRGGVTA